MEFPDIFQQCPRCSRQLTHKKPNLTLCNACGFHFYFNPAPCNAIIIENLKNEILLVKRRYDPHKGYWDLPGGFIEAGESAEQSVVRELKEELGVTVGDLRYLYSLPDYYHYKNIRYSTLGMVFAGKAIQSTFTPGDDVSGYAFFKYEDIPYEQIAFVSVKKALQMYTGQ